MICYTEHISFHFLHYILVSNKELIFLTRELRDQVMGCSAGSYNANWWLINRSLLILLAIALIYGRIYWLTPRTMNV